MKATEKKKVNPLEWWSENEHIFPVVARLARRFLCIPATTIPAERVFSTMGNVLTIKRRRLLPRRAEMLCFLRENVSILEQFSTLALSIVPKK